ncbi:ankyrin repeat protein [Lactarius vividus]|nr:ankyrin repeat protein [Lactarius vividus]
MLEVARLLIDHGAKANAENVRGETPLHLVSQYEAYTNGNSDVARLLLNLGVDANARDKYQATPLHFACYRGLSETALVLLDNGADVNAQNAEGWTPLDRAINSYLHNDDRIVHVMLEHGADMNTWGWGRATL